MLKERQSPGQVTAVLRTSPGLKGGHADADRYVKEVVKNACKARDTLAP